MEASRCYISRAVFLFTRDTRSQCAAYINTLLSFKDRLHGFILPGGGKGERASHLAEEESIILINVSGAGTPAAK